MINRIILRRHEILNACYLILGFAYDVVNVGVFLVLEDYRVFFDCGLWGFLLWLLV